MIVFHASPAKDFIGRRLLGFYLSVGKRIARAVVYVALLSCAFAGGENLIAQETGAAADPGKVAVLTQATLSESSSASAAFGCSLDDSADPDIDAQAGQKSLPNAPTAQTQADDHPAPQTKRILGIIPNFRAISTDVKLPPQTVKDKFMDATQDSFDYSSILLPGLLAAYSMGRDATPEFHQGAAGYARYFWHAAVDQTSENYMVEFIVPVITREDTRFYTMGRGGFLKRTEYALTRSVITRSDNGKEEFNISEVVGAGASAGLSSLYYPTRERSFANTGEEWGLDVGIDAASYVVREFWPDINHKLFRGAKPSAVIEGEQKQ